MMRYVELPMIVLLMEYWWSQPETGSSLAQLAFKVLRYSMREKYLLDETGKIIVVEHLGLLQLL